MNRRFVRSLLAITILVATVAASVYFLATHPAIGHQLTKTPAAVLTSLFALYLLFIGCVWLIFRASLVLCGIKLPLQETLLVTAYTSIINFFGPLQSGPAFRALYLKKRHAVGVSTYALASLVYYFFYAFFSGLFLVSGLLGWWTVLLGLAGLAGLFGLIKLPIKKVQQMRQFSRRGVIFSALSAFLQVSVFVIIFFVELRSVNQVVTLQQAIIYTGAANFALFVSITPAAIGFRESFVLLAQQLHHIPNATTIAASLIDRGVYVAVLLFLGVFIFGSQARGNLKRLTS